VLLKVRWRERDGSVALERGQTTDQEPCSDRNQGQEPTPETVPGQTRVLQAPDRRRIASAEEFESTPDRPGVRSPKHWHGPTTERRQGQAGRSTHPQAGHRRLTCRHQHGAHRCGSIIRVARRPDREHIQSEQFENNPDPGTGERIAENGAGNHRDNEGTRHHELWHAHQVQAGDGPPGPQENDAH
jgi:hypothetical protein